MRLNEDEADPTSAITIAGFVGLIGALLTGTGEFVLHFDALGRFGTEYEFFRGISDNRTTLGHFFVLTT